MVLAYPEAPTAARSALHQQFAGKIRPNPALNRKLVSYQADKETPFYRWFKYREGFASELVAYLLAQVHPTPGHLLDPFAGSGSALFAAATLGWQTTGIEVLPVGIYAAQARSAAVRVDAQLFAQTAAQLCGMEFTDFYDDAFALAHIAITTGAFPLETERELIGYRAYCTTQITDPHIRQLALFASFCILEEISYTRKDGQYLRWDARSGRTQGVRPFNKGPILTFPQAIRRKLGQIVADLTAVAGQPAPVQGALNLFVLPHTAPLTEHRPMAPVAGSDPQLVFDSCLTLLPAQLEPAFDVILTSPPYCNRYDYTRTYALELVYLGTTHQQVTQLRQNMLSCTVENKTKVQQMQALYTQLGRAPEFERIAATFNEQAALQEVLGILDRHKAEKQLNNPKIADLVRNYFYEMGFVIFEMARLLRPGGHIIMVNDNVRYAGEEVPVDIILSSMAESFGLVTQVIWQLPQGKGNSSQQMGEHGRTELRKCIYVWHHPIPDL